MSTSAENRDGPNQLRTEADDTSPDKHQADADGVGIVLLTRARDEETFVDSGEGA